MNSILLVEDNASFRETIAELLELEDYIVAQAENGKEALQLLEQIIPHLIVCDVKMVETTGIEFVAKVKQDTRLAQIPIILMTGIQDPEIADLAELLGVNELLSKPVEGDELLAKIKDLLAK